MVPNERQQAVLCLLQDLRGLEGLKKLFWEELNYERENKPLSPRSWPVRVRQALAEDPILFASGGEGSAFHLISCRLASQDLSRGLERPVVHQMLAEHPYALFIFSNKNRSAWHFLNVKYDAEVEKRRLFRRMTVQSGTGLRTATERLQMLDLESFGRDLFGLPALEIQQRHDEAFDVERVTKEFYEEIANWYFWALEHRGVVFPRDVNGEEQQSIFLIRLLTRLIFCWFLQEKDLIPARLFDRRQAESLLKDPSPQAGSFYKAFLQNLFFATLNQEQELRAFRKKYDSSRDGNRGATNLYRYADLLTDPEAFLELLRQVPFVNGGLFDCLDRVFVEKENRPDVRLDDFSEEKGNALCIPNELFFGQGEVDLSKRYDDSRHRHDTVRGLISIFGRYRFTIEENTPLDQELALDPELLGKVFENLLASYNEDTRTTARKATGSFYTPREIVSYLVDESLVAYLAGGLKGKDGGKKAEERLRRLMATEETHHDFSEDEVEALVAAVDRVKILDPACGSGAFPMGALHRLVDFLKKLDPNNRRWKQQQLAKARHDLALARKMQVETNREAAVKEAETRVADIEHSFDTRFHALDYARKLYLIENCIYGVDIQPIACQITKLRFFISLIVDQHVDDRAPNRGVRALPNLETRIVAADTLVPVQRADRLVDLFEMQVRPLRQELEQVRHEYFMARTPGRKARCRQRDADLRAKVADLLRENGMPADTSKALAHWDPYDQNKHVGFFDPEWMFGVPIGRVPVTAQSPSTLLGNLAFVNQVRGQMELAPGTREVESGFDIVLGNPPYVRLQTLTQKSPKMAAFFKEHYDAAKKGNYDLYVVFIERGLQLLKPEGVLGYICPHKFFNAEYGAPLRELIAKGRHLSHVVHFGDQQVFPGATNYVCLLFLAKAGAETCRWVRADDLRGWLDSLKAPETAIPKDRITSAEWNFAVGKGAGLFEKLQRMPCKLGDAADIFVGLQTSADDVFIMKLVSQTARTITLASKTLGDWTFEKELLHPVVSGTDVSAYGPLPNRQHILFPYQVEDEKAELLAFREILRFWPRTAEYLKRNRKRLEKRENGAFKDQEWYRFGRSQNLGIQNRAKVCVPRLVEELHAALDFEGSHFLDNVDVGGLTLREAFSRHSLAYLLGLLNSRLMRWFFPQVSAPFRGGYRSANRQFLSLLPFRRVDFALQSDAAEHDALVKLVERILAAKRKTPGADTLALEREIDECVYRLYGLTKDEVKIVEESVG